jgi:hypothetical protein
VAAGWVPTLRALDAAEFEGFVAAVAARPGGLALTPGGVV